jgi:hypothetical protein
MWMRLRLALLAAVASLVVAGPALAQSQGSGGSGGSSASAGGSSVSSGNTSSSASVNTTGGTNVGVVQGSVAEGSSGSTSSGTGAASDNGGSSNSSSDSAGAAEAPNAAKDGILKRLDLPAIGTATDATPVSQARSDIYLWALAAAVVVGLGLLYKRLPRPSSA